MVKYLDKAGLEHLVNGIKILLYEKVDKEAGKGLSTYDFGEVEKQKLAGIEEGANSYTHPDSPGSRHIPAGGSSGQILKWSAAGVAAWEDSTAITKPEIQQAVG